VSTARWISFPQRIPVVEQRRGDERLAVNESQAEQLAEDDVGRDAKRRRFLDRLQPLRERSVEAEEGVDQILKLGCEHRVRGVDRVEPPPGRCEIDHADVVEICREQTVGDQEREPLRRAR
jgi:hypothetical protein